MEHYFDNHDVLNDVKRLNTKCKHLDNQWGDFKKIVEEKDTDRDYQRMLRFILDKAELYEHHKREHDNIIIIDGDDDDCVLENDPQYELFLRRLKKHDKSYIVEGENNGVPLYIEYEAESGSKSKDEFEHKRLRKMKSRVEKINVLFNQNHRGSNVRAMCIRECNIAHKVQSHRKLKGKNIVKVDDEDTKPIVQIDSEYLYRKRGRRDNWTKGDHCKCVDRVRPSKKDKVGQRENFVRGDNGLISREIGLRKYAAKDHLDRNVKAQSSRKRTHCDIRNVKAESSKEGDDDMDSDVEILDDAGFRKNLSSFVPSKKFYKSMEEDADFLHVGSTSVCNGFRKQVLDVLKKPFDQEELKRLRESVRDGSYYHYYPDLERKLKKSRYKRGKCLNIFRRFFFWLQNVSQEGAFKPWKDGQCLAVKPGPLKKSPPPHSTYLERVKQSKHKILK